MQSRCRIGPACMIATRTAPVLELKLERQTQSIWFYKKKGKKATKRRNDWLKILQLQQLQINIM